MKFLNNKWNGCEDITKVSFAKEFDEFLIQFFPANEIK
jgi:hypothetical protein